MLCLAGCLLATAVHATDDAPPKLTDVLQQEEADLATGAASGGAPQDGPIPAPGPTDLLERETPRGALRGYIAAARAGDYERAAEYLDLRNLPRGLDASRGPEYARQLKIVLERALWIDLDRVSADPGGQTEDKLPSYRDWLGAIEVDGAPIDILLQRVPLEGGDFGWKFSNATVAQIPALYAAYGYGEIGEWLSATLPQTQFLGLELWQWVMALGLLAVAFGIAWLPTAAVAWAVRRRATPLAHQFSGLIAGPVRLLITVVLFRGWFDLVHPSIAARAVAEGQLLLIVAITWGLLRGVDIFRDRMATRMDARGASQARMLLRPASNIIKIFLIVGAGIVYLENLGFRATTLIAGLGIGGIAVALAAQKSVENLIGAITLVASAPVKVGDFCRFGDKVGVVQDIGLRWTRIRSLERTVIHVPNASFAEMQLENFVEREKILFNPRIRLRYDTSPDQVRLIIAAGTELLATHPSVEPDLARLRFGGFGSEGLELTAFCYVKTADYLEYLGIAEELNLRLMDLIAEAGTALAVPTQRVLLDNSTAPNP
jgi:MscS family membrane protein